MPSVLDREILAGIVSIQRPGVNNLRAKGIHDLNPAPWGQAQRHRFVRVFRPFPSILPNYFSSPKRILRTRLAWWWAAMPTLGAINPTPGLAAVFWSPTMNILEENRVV